MKKLFLFLVLVFLNVNISFGLSSDTLYTTLPSGQKVVIKENHDNEIVKIDTWINTGSINEDDKTNGISHFLEHLFFKGTQNNPTGTFDKILDSKGAEVNAATSKDYTHYYIQIPSVYFDTALELHSDMLLNPMIPRKELERERPVVIEEISKTKDSPINRMYDNLYKTIYTKSNHPYKRTVIGTKENIQNVTREEILAYYNRFYTPDAFTTVIVGDVDKNETLKKVANAFNQKKSKQEHVKYPQIKPINKIEAVSDTMDINKTHMMMGFLAPKFSDEKNTYPLDVLATILTNGKSSILNQKLKEEKNLVLSVSAANYSQKDSGLFYIYSTLEPQYEKQVISEIVKELNKIQQGNLDENALKRAKNLIKTDIYYSRESISNITEELGYNFTFSTNENYYDDYIKNIEKVTKQDVINAAKKYLDTNKYIVSSVRPKTFDGNFKEISTVVEKNTQANLVETKDNVKKYTLPSGANLILKNKKTNSIIAFDINIKGSKFLEKKPASASMTASTLTTGTENYTNSELHQFLDENGIKLGASATNDIFSISLQTTKENLQKALIALDEVINHPTFNDNEIEKIRKRKIQELKGISDSPSRFVFDEFKKLAFLNTIYGQNSSFMINALNNLKREDIVQYYSTILNPKNITITVVGDIDEKEMIEKFNNIIKPNKNNAKFSFENTKLIPYRPTKNVETTLYKDEVQANWMALGYKTCGLLGDKNRKDIATLNVINAILGQGMSSRLFVHLREEQSLAYTVGSSLMNNILDGAFVAYIGTNSSSINQAKKGLMDEINTLKTEMVTTKELDDAKNKILGQLLLGLETNMEEASLLGWYDVLNRDLNALEDYKKLIKSVNQNDIIETANRYFSKPYIYTVVKARK